MSTPDSAEPRRRTIAGHARRTAIFVTGWVVVAAGLAMLVLPGPGLLVVIGGLSILAVEFAWARRLRDRANERMRTAAQKAKGAIRKR